MLIAPSPYSLWVPPVECLVRIVPDCAAEQKPIPVVPPNPAAAPDPIAAPDPVAAPSLVVISIPEAPSTTIPLAQVFVQTFENGRKFCNISFLFYFLLVFDIHEQLSSKANQWEKTQLYD